MENCPYAQLLKKFDIHIDCKDCTSPECWCEDVKEECLKRKD